MSEWNPDPELIRKFEEAIQKGSGAGQIAVGRRILTWEDMLEEVKTGTQLGRSYYRALVETFSTEKQRELNE
jgi:hypothetical protein